MWDQLDALMDNKTQERVYSKTWISVPRHQMSEQIYLQIVSEND